MRSRGLSRVAVWADAKGQTGQGDPEQVVELTRMGSVRASDGILEHYRDVQIATEVGLLDLVSVLLAIVAILLAIGGVFAFFNFRSLARKQATEEANRISAEVAERVAIERLEKELPKMADEYRELVKNSVDSEAANEIARAHDEES